MVPHPVLLEEIPPLLDGDADSQQDGPTHADIWVLLLDLSRLPWGWYFKNQLFSGKSRWEFFEFLEIFVMNCDAQCDSSQCGSQPWILCSLLDWSQIWDLKQTKWQKFFCDSDRRRVRGDKFFLKKSEISPTCYVTAARSRVKNLKIKFYYPRGTWGPPLTLSRKEMMR